MTVRWTVRAAERLCPQAKKSRFPHHKSPDWSVLHSGLFAFVVRDTTDQSKGILTPLFWSRDLNGFPTARKYSRFPSLDKLSPQTPYFLRARHEKQLSTVFPSLTRHLHQGKDRVYTWSLFFLSEMLFTPNEDGTELIHTLRSSITRCLGESSAPGGLLSIFLGGEEQAGLSMYIPQRTDKCEKRGVCQLLASWYAICGTVDIL